MYITFDTFINKSAIMINSFNIFVIGSWKKELNVVVDDSQLPEYWQGTAQYQSVYKVGRYISYNISLVFYVLNNYLKDY